MLFAKEYERTHVDGSDYHDGSIELAPPGGPDAPASGWRPGRPASGSLADYRVNSWVCGLRWPSFTALAVSLPLNRNTFRPSLMLVS